MITHFQETVVLNLSRRCVGFLRSLSLRGCKSVGDGALRYVCCVQCSMLYEDTLKILARFREVTFVDSKS